jgi:hypothetical protein
MSAAPIACMLSGNDFKERLRWIADLNRTSLKDSNRDDLRLILRYETDALSQVRQMVEHEQACCRFLSFDVAERSDGITLTIMAPEEAREAADMVFAPFEQADQGKSGCSCCAGAP